MIKKVFFTLLLLFFLPSLVKADYGIAELFFRNLEFLEVTLINFTIPNPNVPQGQSVELDVEVQNTGTLDANVTSIVEIFNNATNESVGNVSNNYGILGPGEIVTIKSFWSTNTLGTYKAIAKAMYDSQNTTNQTEYFKIVSPTPPARGPSGAPIVPPPPVVVEFVQWTILREIAIGQATVLGIIVKNTGNSTISGLKVEISGIPEGWATVRPKTLDLAAKEKKGFTIAMSVPSNASAGDYKVSMTVSNDRIHAENFFILRVRYFVPEYDKPIFLRVVDLDVEAEKTSVDIIVNNANKAFPLVEVIEKIPKELANTSDIVDFETKPAEIISKDPLVQWDLVNLKVNEERKISYSVPKILGEFTGYIYWPLEQVNLITTKLPRIFSIIDIKIPICYPGTTCKATFTVENPESIAYSFKATIELPEGWKISEQFIEDTIQAEQKKELSFEFSVPEKTVPGTYILRIYLSWDGSETIAEYPVMVQKFVLPTKLILFSLIILGVVVLLYFIYKRRRKPKISAIEKMRRIKKEIVK